MGILHRHISAQILTASLLAIGLFVFILLAGNVLRDLLGLLASGRISGQMAGQMLVWLLPYMVSYALPFGFLTAVLVVLGRMSVHQEITAMKAAGISLYHMAAPIFLLAMIASVGMIFINFQYAPTAKTAYKSTLKNVLRTNPLQFIQPKVFVKDFPGYVLYAENIRDGRIEDAWIWVLDEQGRAREFLRAETCDVVYNPADDTIIVRPKGIVAEKRSSSAPEDFSRPIYTATGQGTAGEDIRLPLDKIFGSNKIQRKLSMLTLPELLERRKLLLSGNGEVTEGQPLQQAIIKVQFAIQKNFAMALSILSFAALGIPLGIKASRTETYANLALALCVALTFYVMMVLIGFLENTPAARPDLLIWLPNLILQGGGLWLLIRANQH